MLLRSLLLLSIVASLAACEDPKPPNAPPKTPPATDDASVEGRVQPKADAAGPGLGSAEAAELAKLEGRWTGEGQSQSFGQVRGEFVVQSNGVVFAKVTGNQLARSENLQLVSWDGKELSFRHEEVGTIKIAARLQGEALVLSIPNEGDFTLARSADKGLK